VAQDKLTVLVLENFAFHLGAPKAGGTPCASRSRFFDAL
jgi:hypothetical protein